MVELRCNRCPNLKNDLCEKLKEVLPNGMAKLYYGGAVGFYYKDVTYASKCGIEKEVKETQKFEIMVSIPDKEILEQRPQPSV
jgi:hypothetical protein